MKLSANMSTDDNLILAESVKFSLYSDVIMTFLLKNHNSDWDKIDQRHLAVCVSARSGHRARALKQKSKLINSLQQ